MYLFSKKNSPKVMDVLNKTKGQLRKRQAHIYDMCKAKRICDGGTELEKNEDGIEGQETKKVGSERNS